MPYYQDVIDTVETTRTEMDDLEYLWVNISDHVRGLAARTVLQDIVDNYDGDGEANIYEGYSGRGMYGKKCYGIICDDATNIIERAAQAGIVGAQMDSLGRSSIVYWPKLGYEDDSDEE